MNNKYANIYITVLAFFLLIYIIYYLLITAGLVYTRHSVIIDAVVYLGFYVSYLWRYRRENLLCFELMAMPIGFIGLFFLDVILDYLPLLTRIYDVGNDMIKEKSHALQMIGWLAFLFGSINANNKRKRNVQGVTKRPKYLMNYKYFLYFLTGLLFLVIVYDYYSGIFDSWFYYSNRDVMDVEDRNKGLGHLTCLIVAASVIDVVRLRDMGVSGYLDYLKKCNKTLVIEWLFVGVLLYLSGNRNEMLLVMLPMIVSFSVCIKKITNKVLIIGVAVGVILMVLAGTSRQENVSVQEANFSGESFFVDFTMLGYNCDYMVQYTDQHGPIYFSDMPGFILSGVPFVGPRLLDVVGYEPPARSSTLCTDSVNAFSGLGTSLIGDLYYGGGFIWVLFFMYIFGYTMSCLYNSDKYINKYHLLFYSYMVANAVYYVRSQWGFPIGTIIYCFFILLIGDLFFRRKSIRNR